MLCYMIYFPYLCHRNLIKDKHKLKNKYKLET